MDQGVHTIVHVTIKNDGEKKSLHVINVIMDQ